MCLVYKHLQAKGRITSRCLHISFLCSCSPFAYKISKMMSVYQIKGKKIIMTVNHYQVFTFILIMSNYVSDYIFAWHVCVMADYVDGHVDSLFISVMC